jgi:hypothetical protein
MEFRIGPARVRFAPARLTPGSSPATLAVDKCLQADIPTSDMVIRDRGLPRWNVRIRQQRTSPIGENWGPRWFWWAIGRLTRLCSYKPVRLAGRAPQHRSLFLENEGNDAIRSARAAKQPQASPSASSNEPLHPGPVFRQPRDRLRWQRPAHHDRARLHRMPPGL